MGKDSIQELELALSDNNAYESGLAVVARLESKRARETEVKGGVGRQQRPVQI